MNKNYTTLKTNIGAEIQDPSSNFATIIGRFINRRYFQILRAINWQNIQPDYTFNTVAGQQRYTLPDDFGKEISCADTTNNAELSRKDLAKLFEEYQDITDSGTVQRYCILDDCVMEQPSSASVLTITPSIDDSIVDASQTIFIRGISNGVEVYESLTLADADSPYYAEAKDTANSYTRIKSISKSAATTGYLTITSNTLTKTQAIIPPEILETRYKIALLHYVPTSIYTIAMPYIINPLPLSQDFDYPILDIGDLIELGALADAWRYKCQFGKAQTMEVLFNQQLQEFIFAKENQPNQIYQFEPTPYDRETV